MYPHSQGCCQYSLSMIIFLWYSLILFILSHNEVFVSMNNLHLVFEFFFKLQSFSSDLQCITNYMKNFFIVFIIVFIFFLDFENGERKAITEEDVQHWKRRRIRSAKSAESLLSLPVTSHLGSPLSESLDPNRLMNILAGT